MIARDEYFDEEVLWEARDQVAVSHMDEVRALNYSEDEEWEARDTVASEHPEEVETRYYELLAIKNRDEWAKTNGQLRKEARQAKANMRRWA